MQCITLEEWQTCNRWIYFMLTVVMMCHDTMTNRNRGELAVALIYVAVRLTSALMLLLASEDCYIKWINYLFIVRDWDTVSVSYFSNIGQSYLPPVCCVVSFLLSLNATYFKHASTSCSMTKTKPKRNISNPFSASTVSLWCTPRLHGRFMFKD